MNDIIEIVRTLYTKYENDEYIKEKFQKFMLDHLPNQVLQWKIIINQMSYMVLLPEFYKI